MTRLIMFQAGMSNAYYIIGDKGVIAIDTGANMGKDAVYQQCEAAGILPGDIKLIIITHGHADHFMNLPALKAVTNAEILCHENAAHFLINGELPDVDIAGRTAFGTALLKKQAREGGPVEAVPKINPDILMQDAYDLRPWGVEGKIYHTPGHSRGDISIVLDCGDAIVGDLFAAEAFHEDSDMPYFFYSGARFEEAQESVQKLLDLGVQMIYSGHGNPSDRTYVKMCLEREKRINN